MYLFIESSTYLPLLIRLPTNLHVLLTYLYLLTCTYLLICLTTQYLHTWYLQWTCVVTCKSKGEPYHDAQVTMLRYDLNCFDLFFIPVLTVMYWMFWSALMCLVLLQWLELLFGIHSLLKEAVYFGLFIIMVNCRSVGNKFPCDICCKCCCRQ